MSVAEVSRERVEQRLAHLEEDFDSFPVNQTTLTVSAPVYERARERCRAGLVDAYVTVENDDGEVLLVDRDGDRVVPHVEPASSARLRDGTCRGIRDLTGVECALTGLDRVTILGVCHEDDPERNPVYRLVTVFTAERVGGEPGPDSGWYADVPGTALPRY